MATSAKQPLAQLLEEIGAQQKTSLSETLRLASIFAAITLLIHIAINLRAQHIGYGLFRDELYYLICGHNLAWGYVDHPPVIVLATRLTELLFGFHSLVLFRLVPTLAGALEVALTSLLVREMGGRRTAQAFAMFGIMLCPAVLAIDSFVSMNALEPVFWMGTAYAVLRAVRGDGSRWWIAAGVIASIGLDNKWNETFFLLALLPAILLTPARRTLGRYFALCIVLILLLAVPNLLWEAHRGWPTLLWLHNASTEGKNIVYGPGMFIFNQLFLTGPLSAFLWVGGLVWLLIGRGAKGLRWVGIIYLLYLPAMMALHANDYYLAPIYPLYFAAGGVAWTQWLRPGLFRRIALTSYGAVILGYGVLGILIVQPVLTPSQYVRLIPAALKPHEFNASKRSPLPELLADMTGWKEMTNKLAEVYYFLSLEDRSKAVILTKNYGEASAVNVYRSDLPTAISGHQNYWYWGPRGHDGSVVIAIGLERSLLEQRFATVTQVAQTANPWGNAYEAVPIYLCRGAKTDLRDAWPLWKLWI